MSSWYPHDRRYTNSVPNKTSFNADKILSLSENRNNESVLACWNSYGICTVGCKSYSRWFHVSEYSHKRERPLQHTATLRETLTAGRDLDIVAKCHPSARERNPTHYTSNARLLHSSHRKLLNHPHFRPELAPSDYHLFGPLQQHFGDCRFNNGEIAVLDWLRRHQPDFFAMAF